MPTTTTYDLSACACCDGGCCPGMPDTVNITLSSPTCAAANGATGTLTYDAGNDEWVGSVNVGGKSVGFAMICTNPEVGCEGLTMTAPASGSYDCTSQPLSNGLLCDCAMQSVTFGPGGVTGTNCCGGSGNITDITAVVDW